jgi:hypothetical protein
MPLRRDPGVRRPRAALFSVGLVCLLSSLAVGVVGAGASSSTTRLREGVYVGAAAPSRVQTFDTATHSHSTIAGDYLPANAGWSGMDGQNGSLRWMLADGWTGTSYTLSLGVPIIPSDGAGDPVGTLATGAKGAYNAYFVTLAQTLVTAGEANAYLRLGWEFDGGWNSWEATHPTSEINFAAYFRQIVRAMRSVPGQKFRFVWNPDADAFTDSNYNVALAYPGNAYVNMIGLDAYDQSWVTPLTAANAWAQTTLPALTAGEKFAVEKDKPLAMNEWGTAIRKDGHGLGDDPLYVSNMIAWMRNPANRVIFETYFNYDGRGTNSVITDGQFPDSLRAFRVAFHLTNARTTNSEVPWLPWAALFVVASGGLVAVRRARRRRPADVPPRRIYPPLPEVALPAHRDLAEQLQ